MYSLKNAAKSYRTAADKEKAARETRDWQIKHAAQAGTSVSEIARITGLTRQQIYNILNREV